MRNKKIILTRPYGQTSNIFFQHAYFDAFCREHEIKFVNPYMQSYYKDYPHLNEHGRSKLMDYLTRKMLKKKLKWKMIKSVDFDDLEKVPAYDDYVLNSRETTLYCEGWYFRHTDLMIKYRKIYQHLFAPDVDKAEMQKSYLTKTNDQLLIAVHIRRGDYKEYLDGRYFYDDALYIDKIRELVTALGGDYKLIIFTNDPVLNEAVYRSHFGNLIISRNNVKTDHYLMSQCDYIIGPPSRFSLWASYMGDKPYYHIYEPEETVTLDKFEKMYA